MTTKADDLLIEKAKDLVAKELQAAWRRGVGAGLEMALDMAEAYANSPFDIEEYMQALRGFRDLALNGKEEE